MSKDLEKIYFLIKKIKNGNRELDEVSSLFLNNEGSEIIIGPYSLNEAQKIVTQYINQSKAFLNGSNPNIGTLKKSYGYGKVIGIQSFDGNVSTRIDFSPDKGYHFHYEDYTKDKSVNYCILINDLTERAYEAYIDCLSMRCLSDKPKTKKTCEDSLEVLFYKKNKENIELIRTLKKIYNYEFLNYINPNDSFSNELLDLIFYVEFNVQNNIFTLDYREILDEYLINYIDGASINNFINYINFYGLSLPEDCEKTLSLLNNNSLMGY